MDGEVFEGGVRDVWYEEVCSVVMEVVMEYGNYITF
jgi:hypothetical protein